MSTTQGFLKKRDTVRWLTTIKKKPQDASMPLIFTDSEWAGEEGAAKAECEGGRRAPIAPTDY